MDLKELMGKKKSLKPEEKDAKLSALKHMKSIASEAMKDGLKGGLSKVTVAADNPEDLKKGLDKAKELMPEMSGHEEESPEEEAMEEECSTPEEVDKKIQELMELKKKLMQK